MNWPLCLLMVNEERLTDCFDVLAGIIYLDQEDFVRGLVRQVVPLLSVVM